jgi:RNA polymerase sigma-70 factor, ECF subfamily
VTSQPPDEQTLIALLVRERDPAVWATLYTTHTPMLYALALRLVGNGSDAEDIVHDTWLRAMGALSGFRGRSSFRTWLAGILVNRTREHLRERPQEPLDDKLYPDIEAMPRLPLDVDAIDLERALGRMPHRYREVVLLYDVEGFTHAEISELLGVAIGTSKSQLARGRGWLRKELVPGEAES